MQTAAVLSFSDAVEHPHAELVLRKGDRVQISLDREGLTIRQMAGASRPTAVVFQADPNLTSHLCAALCAGKSTATPLRILVSAVVQLNSARDVAQAFCAAAAEMR